MPKDDRILVIAAGHDPALCDELAEPFDSDKAQGFDLQPAANWDWKSRRSATGGIGVLRASKATRRSGPKAKEPAAQGTAYLLKLERGTTPGQWLVESITPQ